MAYWFHAIFLLYGFIAEFHETNCFGNPWSYISTSEERTFQQNFESRNLQRNKNVLVQKHFNEDELLKTLNPNCLSNSMFDENRLKKHKRSIENGTTKIVPSNLKSRHSKPKMIIKTKQNLKQTRYKYRKIPMKGRRFKEGDTNETKHSNISTLPVQVPDDDIEDSPAEFSDEIQLEQLVEPSKSIKYFYRKNKKVLVAKDWEETANYHNNILNRQSESINGEDTDYIRQHTEELLHKEDALEKLNQKGPAFSDTMTWVNMMRANRGWYPKDIFN